jgi:hypothetical protein
MALDIDEAKVARNEAGLWGSWTIATAAAMLLGFLPMVVLIDYVDSWIMRILVPLWAGFLVGLFQWLALRKYLTHTTDWVLNDGAGWALGFAVGLVVIETLSGSILGTVIGYLLFGVIIAVAQWPALHREIPNVIPWVAASVIGWALGAFLSFVLVNLLLSESSANLALASAITALVTGLVAGGITGLALVYIARQPDYQAA